MATYARSLAPAVQFDWKKFIASPTLWCVAVVVLIAAQELVQGYGDLLAGLGDTDDALRLHQVRELMAGKSWTDMSLPRLGGATPLVSHWSRLVDLPLAALIAMFGSVLSPEKAELATRIVWPLVVLALFFRVAVRAAGRQGADAAPVLFLVIAATCVSGLFQFHIGRIDHHNMMILGAVGGLLLMVGARRDAREGSYAGALIGLGLAVGYEPLALLLPAVAGAALLAIYDLRWLAGIRNLMVTLAGVLALVFFATVAPSNWFVARCDALSLNMVLLTACGAGGMTLADRFGRSRPFAVRLSILAAAGAVGALLFALQDTRCLAGPFGQIDPRVVPIWLDKVVEGYNAIRMFQTSPLPVVAYAATVGFGLWAAIERWRRLRSPEAAMLAALMLMAAPFGFWIVKLIPYASWIAVFCIALSLADIERTEKISAPTLQFAGVLAVNQWVILLAASQIMLALGVSGDRVAGKQDFDAGACLKTDAIRALNALPKGFVVGNIDLGSYIVALTPHDILAAPYHRIDKAIIASQSILQAPPAVAETQLGSVRADYLVVCLPKPGATPPDLVPHSLMSELISGAIPAYLEPMPLDSPVAELKAWRVRR